MKIRLAGFNADIDLLMDAAQFFDRDGVDSAALSPETISAAYARISRDPKSVTALRAAAIKDVAKARASNEQIVFGMGHASVAEHAVFNFDLMGVSRLVIEAIEQARLCSYTEKSQRYTQLGEEFVVPQEIVEAGLEADFKALLAEQYAAYCELYEGICAHLLSQAPDADKDVRKAIEGKAKEDARYVTSLAVEGQLGMTCNARNLEYMIRRLLSHPLHEAKMVAGLLYAEAREIAPSLLRHLDPTPEQLRAMFELRQLSEQSLDPVAHKAGSWPQEGEGPVRLLEYDEDADRKIMGALLYAHSGMDADQCESAWIHMEPEQGNRLLRAVFGSLREWDAVPRAFELADFRFELAVSASCFAQLKRHRMATILPQAYDVFLGYTVPSSVTEAGLGERFKDIMDRSAAMWGELRTRNLGDAAAYALTQAHRRRVVVKMNARELYHFSRLRQDTHAQWDIRNVADHMVGMARRVCPLTMLLACGKHAFEHRKTVVP